jgi:hypothetical protein
MAIETDTTEDQDLDLDQTQTHVHHAVLIRLDLDLDLDQFILDHVLIHVLGKLTRKNISQKVAVVHQTEIGTDIITIVLVI